MKTPGRPKGLAKTGGRKPGSPNKTTKEMRLIFQNFVEDNLERLQADFDELTPSERVTFLLKLIPSFLPPPPPEETWQFDPIMSIKTPYDHLPAHELMKLFREATDGWEDYEDEVDEGDEVDE